MGANRLASNSLLEALVYAHNIYKLHSKKEPESIKVNIPDWNDEGTIIPEEHILINQI